MRVFVVKGVSRQVRGLLSRYAVEVSTGVFVSTIPSDRFHWLMDCVAESGEGSALAIEPDPRANLGYRVRGFGDLWHSMVDIDGLLVKRGRKS